MIRDTISDPYLKLGLGRHEVSSLISNTHYSKLQYWSYNLYIGSQHYLRYFLFLSLDVSYIVSGLKEDPTRSTLQSDSLSVTGIRFITWTSYSSSIHLLLIDRSPEVQLYRGDSFLRLGYLPTVSISARILLPSQSNSLSVPCPVCPGFLLQKENFFCITNVPEKTSTLPLVNQTILYLLFHRTINLLFR